MNIRNYVFFVEKSKTVMLKSFLRQRSITNKKFVFLQWRSWY